jgi:hypothetical protein
MRCERANRPAQPQPHNHDQGDKVNPTEPIANPASTPKAGLFATLRVFLRRQGTGASKIAQGSGAPSRVSLLVAFLLALAATMVFTAAPAGASTRRYGMTGSLSGVPGGFANPVGVAVDSATGDVYVADYTAGVLDQFDSAGVWQSQATVPGGAPYQVAVDNDPSSPSYGDVYVAGSAGNVVYKFATTILGELALTPPVEVGSGSLSTPTGVAVDAAGDLYAASEKTGVVAEFSPTGTLLHPDLITAASTTTALAVDSSGNIYVAGSGTVEYTAAGTCVNTGCTPVSEGTDLGVAVDTANDVFVTDEARVIEYGPSAGHPLVEEFGSFAFPFGLGVGNGKVYVTDFSAPAVDVFEEGSPPAPPTTNEVEPVAAFTATFNGHLTLSSTDTHYYFDYDTGTKCTGGEGKTTPSTDAGTGSGEVAESAEVTELQPSTRYTVCFVAANDFGAEQGAPVMFNTHPAKPSIESETVSSVKATGARLEGVVNPNNQATECKFQYGTEPLLEKGTTTVACEPAVLGGFGGQPVGVSVSGLEAKTTYYYRVLATNGTGTNEEAIEHFTTPTPPEPPTTSSPATAITETSATLEGVLNPGGGGEAGSYEFVYRQSATECQKTNPDTGQPENELATPTTAAPAGKSAVTAPLEGLAPGAQYTFCLLSRNEAGETALGAPVTFRTVAVLPTITGTSVAEVTATSAKLNAQVDPGGAETTYHFEYDTTPYTTSAPHGQSTPESPSIGADNSLHPATAAIQGLQPGTTYHYRIVATNSQSPAGGTPGPDQTFTTETTGGEFALPDGRAYELVSPLQKDGAEVGGIGGGRVTQALGVATEASEDGTSVTYIASAPVGASPPGNGYSTQMFSTRGAGGWSSLDIATPHKHAIGLAFAAGEEYLRFSSDLSHALLVPLYPTLEPPLAPEIHQEVGGETEIYLRNNATNTFRALVTSEPLPQVSFEGATPDLSDVVFGGPVGLDPNYPNAEGLYEWADGQTRLVSVLPEHKPASGKPGEGAGGLPGNAVLLGSSSFIASRQDVSATRHAISDDGTRVVWNEWNNEGASLLGSLFTRDMATGETLQVDAVQKSGGGVAGGGAFQVANSDGSRVFFTDGNDLVSGAHGGDLYMFEPARPEGERLTDLTLGVAGADLGQVNVLEANEAGTSIYIIGSGNTYLLREAPVGSGSWSSTFVTSGLEESPSNGRDSGLGATEILQRQAARVSPSGRYLAFMSRRSLTGYDNRDAISGEPDEEVYWYDAETNRVVCASCDPTGARPVGQYDVEGFPGVAMDPPGTWEGRWVAAVIPGWTQVGPFRSTGHQPRYLDDSGRLFFTSSDALVPRDVNGRDDVYEYEPVGVGSCRPPSYGQGASVVFNRTLGGCVGLISAGTGNTDSDFFDASASGNDVFFTTEDGLVQNDRDGAADMYDARVCTQAEACPSSFEVSPACTTTDSCRVAPSPQPGIFAAPATATFVGAGNVTPIPSATKKAAKKKTVKCAKGKKRSRGRCVKAKKKNTRAKRARNDRRPGR